MSKKKKKTQKQQNVESASYKLNTKAVDRLVNADKKDYSGAKGDPGKQYRGKGFIDKIPSPVKALFIKFWFNGAVCFFVIMGLGMTLWDTLDMIVAAGVVTGMVCDLLVNNAFHFFAVTPGSNDKWMMFPQRKFWTIFTNAIYGIVIVGIVAYIYIGANHLMTNVMSSWYGVTESKVYFAVEPISYGILCVGVDIIFVGMKNLIVKLITDSKEKTNK